MDVPVPIGKTEPAPGLADEVRQMEVEPLRPVEENLIGWSVGLGVALPGLLVWVNHTLLPAGH